MVLLITNDDALAGTLGERFLRWGMGLIRRRAIEDASQAMDSASVVLLDVRAGGREVIERFKAMVNSNAVPPVLLLNRPDNITVSMAGMRAGAADELTEPFCAETLREKIIEVGRMHSRKRKRSIYAAFTAAMSAAAMAQGGEFEAAVELYNDFDQTPGKPGQTQPEDRDA